MYTLIRSLLITFTRDIRLVEFVRMLTLEAETSYNAFSLQVPSWLYKINANASVISLQHHIKRELDVDAVITELDGKPIDFLVSVNGFVDENRLRALLDEYALAGKSYVFTTSTGGGTVSTYTCEFVNHSCALELVDNVLTLTHDSIQISLSSQFNVKSDVTVGIYVNIQAEPPQLFELVIHEGESSAENLNFLPTQTVLSVEVMDITPVSDYYYNYILD